MQSLFKLCLLMLLGCGVCNAGVYRWVDKDGKVHYSDVQPATTDSEARKLNDNRIEADKFSYDARQTAKAFPVTLYTTADCKDECTKGRELLNQRKIPFAEKTIKSEAELKSLRDQLEGKEPMVPTLIVGKKPVIGFEEGQWQQALDVAGYPKQK